MSVWQYTAAAAPVDGSVRTTRGVITAPSAAAARQSLRQAGLRPVSIRAVRSGREISTRLGGLFAGYLRKRRTPTKAECFDALATLLRSGVTPRDALLVLAGSRSRASGVGILARMLADEVAQGVPLSKAAASHPAWFDGAECAVIGAGERAGELDRALTRLAEHQARAHDLGSRLTSVLAYPALVTAAGTGVAMFLSVRTLPQLTQVLTDAQIEVPVLTRVVMTTGQSLASNAWWLLPVALAVVVGLVLAATTRRGALPRWLLRWTPAVFRRVRTAGSFLSLAELTESGLTLIESVRVMAPTSSGLLGASLGKAWVEVAERIEQGVPLEVAMDDPAWFTEEHRRLIAAGTHASELPETLRRIGERERRSAHRLIDRFAALLEPAAIVLLTFFVGTVVLAAVLPIVRLQEIVG